MRRIDDTKRKKKKEYAVTRKIDLAPPTSPHALCHMIVIEKNLVGVVGLMLWMAGEMKKKKKNVARMDKIESRLVRNELDRPYVVSSLSSHCQEPLNPVFFFVQELCIGIACYMVYHRSSSTKLCK